MYYTIYYFKFSGVYTSAPATPVPLESPSHGYFLGHSLHVDKYLKLQK